MGSDITKVDHAILFVRDLDAAAARYRRLGFSLTPATRTRGVDSATTTSYSRMTMSSCFCPSSRPTEISRASGSSIAPARA